MSAQPVILPKLADVVVITKAKISDYDASWAGESYSRTCPKPSHGKGLFKGIEREGGIIEYRCHKCICEEKFSR